MKVTRYLWNAFYCNFTYSSLLKGFKTTKNNYSCNVKKNRVPVKITYKPTSEAEVNFNVVIRVKKKTTPLTVNVKAQGFKVNMEVVCEDSNGQKVGLSQSGTNVISFGDVSLSL